MLAKIIPITFVEQDYTWGFFQYAKCKIMEMYHKWKIQS